MTHHYKTKISKNDVREYAKRIGEQFSPEKIIWFGSYATGQADSDSDVDLFVILNFRGRAPQKAYEIRKAIPRAF
ncbi:MAG: nucleotidyltransferase domain-containing protein, partial [Elusimicrobiota bacterium]|nr:nucleotidyltransferase domain-containing protein [Elusimicrobiota bacterium]